MKAKIILAAIFVIKCSTDAATTLRRTPKVYNALITSDENLTSSRAYPVIQPTIHETGIAHFPFGPYNPYNGFYSPPLVRFTHPIAPGFLPREQFHQRRQPDVTNYPDYFLPKSFSQPPEEQQPPTVAENEIENEGENQSKAEPGSSGSKKENSSKEESESRPVEKLPIPLNEYGLPPSLVPLQTFAGSKNENPYNLPPYSYSHYPIIYDSFNGFRDQYLPPYDYFPSHTFGFAPTTLHRKPTRVAASSTSAQKTTTTTATAVERDQTSTTIPSFESIQNGSENKNSEVPDVPSPPIPFARKQTQA